MVKSVLCFVADSLHCRMSALNQQDGLDGFRVFIRRNDSVLAWLDTKSHDCLLAIGKSCVGERGRETSLCLSFAACCCCIVSLPFAGSLLVCPASLHGNI